MTRGYQFGFVGSTDNHQSFPAAYLGGRVGVYAESLTRGHLWESIAKRRTIACKGDCIAVWVEANGAPLGSQIKAPSGRVDVRCDIVAEDAIDKVELIRTDRVIKSFNPAEESRPESSDGTFKVRLQIGWGSPVYRAVWKGSLNVKGGRIKSLRPYFVTALGQDPNDAGRQRIVSWDEHGYEFECLACGPPQQVVAVVEGHADTQFILDSNQSSMNVYLQDLLAHSFACRERKHQATAAKLCTAVPELAYTYRFEFTDVLKNIDKCGYYVRVTQRNLQRAWTSPVWVVG